MHTPDDAESSSASLPANAAGAAVPDFARLFAVMPHPYLIVRSSPGFTIVAVNDHYLKATGTQREQLVGRKLFEAFPDNPADSARAAASDLRSSLQRVLLDRVPDVMGVQRYDIPCRDGTDRFELKYWSPINTPVIEGDGSVSFIIHHVEDVTEFVMTRERELRTSHERREQIDRIEQHTQRSEAEVLRRASELKQANREIKAREAELAERNARLQDLNRMKTEFFSSVSHEFRTPLTLMLGPLESLLCNSPATRDEPLREGLEMIHRNAQRLLKLVNTLLEFSRLESHSVTPRWQATNLAQFTTDLAASFRAVCAQAGLQLRIDCAPETEVVLMDLEMWERIVLNLVSNAFKYTLSGCIEVTLRRTDGQLELCVADSGIGIRAEELPHVFEHFYRIEGASGRSHEGSGIGLAMVQDLVALLGGTIAVTSSEGIGTRFTVRVPLRSAPASERSTTPAAPQVSALARAFLAQAQRWLPAADQHAEPAPAQSTNTTGIRILVVDDNTDMRSYLRARLEEAGYTVQTVADGAAACAACRADRPDLVLADVMMGVMSGLEMLERLRSEPHTAELPIILLSARAGEESRSEGVWHGADDYLVKPFQARELLARIDAVMHRAAERKRTQAELRRAATVFTATNEAVMITDAESRIIAVNDAFARITGFSKEEVIGRTASLQRSGWHDKSFYEQLWEAVRSCGYWQGEVWNRRKNGEMYPAWENISVVRGSDGQVTNYVAVFSDIGALKATQDRLAHMAHHDALTDLPNRLLFGARLDQSLDHARRSGDRVGLLLLDLDRFKLINDTLGHAAGDRLLQCVAQRLKQCLRAEDTVARLGGDEFGIILHALANAKDAALVAEKLLQQLSAPIALPEREVVSSASIGISLYPEDASHRDELIKAADTAMYHAKHKGRHTFEFYTAELTAQAEEHLALELDLPRALAKGELELHYQPQLDLTSNKIVGLEALLRWNHPTRGCVPAMQIIKVAEESGFIEQLGKWIIESATRQAIDWSILGLPPMHIAINVSGRQLTAGHLVEQFEAALRRAPMSNRTGRWNLQLDVEMTESMIAALDEGVSILKTLRTLGVGVAIDDFGTGHSSLFRLKSLPVDILKIDRGFVGSLPRVADDCAITAAIIALGHELGLKLVAEGVERPEQLEFLRQHHCDVAQGYLICKPLDVARVTSFLTSHASGWQVARRTRLHR